MEGGKRRGCFKTGCLGSLGCVALVVLIGGGMLAIGFSMGVPDPDPVERALTRDVPRMVVPAQPGDSATALPSEGADLEPTRPPVIPAGQAGTIVLDLSMGEFVIEPGPAGEPIRVEARYDAASFELEETFVPGDDGWEYRVSFGRGISFIRFVSFSGNINNKVRIVVPRDVPFALTGEVGMGESRIELGGLAVTSVDLDVTAGDHEIKFDSPVARPLEWFRIDSSAGELSVEGLGNASPSEVRVHQGAGELRLDLRGSWRTDGEVRATQRFGELSVRLPRDDVNVELVRVAVVVGERNIRSLSDRGPAPPGAPTVSLEVGSFAGEVRVSD